MSHVEDRSSGMIGESKPGEADLTLSIFQGLYAQANDLRSKADQIETLAPQESKLESLVKASRAIDAEIQGKRIELDRLGSGYEDYSRLDHAFKSAVSLLIGDIEAKITQINDKLTQYEETHAEAVAINHASNETFEQCSQINVTMRQFNADREAVIRQRVAEKYRVDEKYQSDLTQIESRLSGLDSLWKRLKNEFALENAKKVALEKLESARKAVRVLASSFSSMMKRTSDSPAGGVYVAKPMPGVELTRTLHDDDAEKVVMLQRQIQESEGAIEALNAQKTALQRQMDHEILEALETKSPDEQKFLEDQTAQIQALKQAIEARREAFQKNPNYLELSAEFQGVPPERRESALSERRHLLLPASVLSELATLKKYISGDEEAYCNYESFSLGRLTSLQDKSFVDLSDEKVMKITAAQANFMGSFRSFWEALTLKERFEALTQSKIALEADSQRLDLLIDETEALSRGVLPLRQIFHKDLRKFYQDLSSLRAGLVREYRGFEGDFPEVTVPQTHRELLRQDRSYLSSYHPVDKAQQAKELLERLKEQALVAHRAKLEAEAAAAELARVQAEADARAREERDAAERAARIAAQERVPSSRTLGEAADQAIIETSRALAGLAVHQERTLWEKVVAFLACCLSCFTCCVKSTAAVAPQPQDSTVVFRPVKREVSSRASSVVSCDSRLSS